MAYDDDVFLCFVKDADDCLWHLIAYVHCPLNTLSIPVSRPPQSNSTANGTRPRSTGFPSGHSDFGSSYTTSISFPSGSRK